MVNITDRHEFILDKIKEEGKVKVLTLSRKLGVSTVTIRKDLKLLEDKGLLFRSHGGASRDNPYINERSIGEKESIKTDEKNKIGEAASKLIEKNESIIIASGTTVLALTRHIHSNHKLTVITASLNVAVELSKQREIEIIQLGGVVRKNSFSVLGTYGKEMLNWFSCSKLFLGIDGLDLDFGLTTTSIGEAQLNQKMIETAQEVIVLSDSSKFGRRGFGKICELDKVDHIITDNNISETYLKSFKEMGIELTLVDFEK